MRAIADRHPGHIPGSQTETAADLNKARAERIAAEVRTNADKLEESYPGDGLQLAAAVACGKYRLDPAEHIVKLADLAARGEGGE